MHRTFDMGGTEPLHMFKVHRRASGRIAKELQAIVGLWECRCCNLCTLMDL